MNWTDARTDELRTLWGRGFSAGQIMKELGVTRNAVIGKVHRLGLSLNDKADGQSGRARQPCKATSIRQTKPRAPKPFKAAFKASFPPTEPDPVVESVADQDIPVGQRRTLLQLNDTTCRWPVNDPGTPEFFFCGDSTASLEARLPYCAVHQRRARGGRYV